MAYRRLDTLLAVAAKGYWIRLTCPCGHEAKHNPMVVFDLVSRRGGDLRLDRLHRSMKCGKCGGKAFTVTHCEGPEIWSG